MTLFFRSMLLIAWASITILAFLPNYSNLPEVISLSDLLNHAVAFSVLTILYTFSYIHSMKRILLTLFAYAVFIEVVQTFLPTRSASFADIGADIGGLIIGFLLGKLLEGMSPFKGQKV